MATAGRLMHTCIDLELVLFSDTSLSDGVMAEKSADGNDRPPDAHLQRFGPPLKFCHL